MHSKRRWLVALLVAVYLYCLLPITAVGFYELYHLTDIGPIYWGYSGFKAAAYYFGRYEYRLPVSVLAGITVAFTPFFLSCTLRKMRG